MQKEITIVGAGLVGSLCALYMTKRGHKVSIFDEVGMDKLVEKSKELTSYLLFLLNTIEADSIEIITPNERGCQLSIRVKNGNKQIFDFITEKGVVADWREPDVIRVAPVPLYNSYMDVFNFYKILESAL